MLGVSSAAASNAESDPGKEGLSVVLGVSSAAASDPESDPSKEGMSRVADGISVGSSSLQSVGSVQSLPPVPSSLDVPFRRTSSKRKAAQSPGACWGLLHLGFGDLMVEHS